MNEKWFCLSIPEIEKKLKTNAASGLSRKAARSAWYRSFQKIPPLFIRKSKKAGKMLAEILSDFALVMLLLAAFFALLFAEHETGVTVLTICIINIAVTFAFYLKSQRTMEKVNLYFTPTANVIRGGRLYRTSFETVVPGDVILVQKGDIICADARLVTSDNLTVLMRTGKQKAVKLSKQAQCVISETETNPANMSNVIHAGSIVKEGSGRAIVFATGTYTYLGAMTGGIAERYNDNTPNELKRMKKICSQISFISMLCILPFTFVSLLFSALNNGNATLSASFLTALSLCASSMTQLCCTICKVFFVRKITAIANGSSPAIIKTTDAFDKLSDIDYLFLLDGSSLTDGVLHFDTAFTAEGEVKQYENYNQTVSTLFDFATLYSSAEKNAITSGINLPDRYRIGLDEFLEKGNADPEALKIRYPIKAYITGTPSDPIDNLHYSDYGKNMMLSVSTSDTVIAQCSHILVSGSSQPLTSIGTDRLKHAFHSHFSQGKTVLIFTLSSLDGIHNDSAKVFIGAIVLREGVDENALNAIKSLNKSGVKVISFVGGDKSTDIPEIPVEVHFGNKAYKEDFLRYQHPISFEFGNIDTYYGLNEVDIERLMDFAHQNGAKVGVVTFSDFAKSVVEKSDVFISCSNIINVFSAKSEEELYTLELAGTGASRSCIQTVKDSSEILIQRPNGQTGGLKSICSVFAAAEVAYRNLYTFFRYMICTQFIRLIMIALPMIYGKPILDARHVLLCSFVIDFFVLLMLSFDNKAVGTSTKNSQDYRITSLKNHILSNKALMIAAMISSVLTIFLPILLSNLGIFEMYVFQVEYLLSAIVWLHLVVAFYTRYNTIKNISLSLKNKWFFGIALVCVAFITIVSTVPSLGRLFDVAYNPLSYFLLSFVPCIVFGIIYEIGSRSHISKKHK